MLKDIIEQWKFKSKFTQWISSINSSNQGSHSFWGLLPGRIHPDPNQCHHLTPSNRVGGQKGHRNKAQEQPTTHLIRIITSPHLLHNLLNDVTLFLRPLLGRLPSIILGYCYHVGVVALLDWDQCLLFDFFMQSYQVRAGPGFETKVSKGRTYAQIGILWGRI